MRNKTMLRCAVLPLAVIALTFSFSIYSPAHAWTVRGTGSGALVGGDLTDPENDIVDNTGAAPYGGINYNWTSVNSSSSLWFNNYGGGNEAALDLFDNRVGGGSDKWYDGGVSDYWLAVEFDKPYTLDSFTIGSGNDSATSRQPDIFQIQGSNDGSTWTDIYSYSNDGTSPWGNANNNQVLEWAVGSDFAAPSPFTWFRLNVDSDNGGGFDPQLTEWEIFGTEYIATVPEPSTIVLALFGLAGMFIFARNRMN